MTKQVMKTAQKHELLIGNVLDVLKTLESESIDLVMTSPPYWGLRDYKIKPFKCSIHKKGCIIGLEKIFNEYLDHIVVVFRDIKRILKKSGSIYLNLGDTYASSGGPSCHHGYIDPKYPKGRKITYIEPQSLPQGVPAKCLMKIPQRVELRLIDELGFIERNDIIWKKTNFMPSSVRDRLTNSYEHIFHFVKQQKYYYDLDAIRIPHTQTNISQKNHTSSINTKLLKEGIKNILEEELFSDGANTGVNNKEPYKKNNPHRTRLKQDNVPGKNAPLYAGFNDRWKKKKYTQGDKDQVDPRYNPGSGTISWAAFKENNPSTTHPKGKNPGDVVEVSPEVRSKNQLGVNKRPSKWGKNHPRINTERWYSENGKNPGDFWVINTQPYPEAHFAVYPEAICKSPILSSCPLGGVVLDPFSGSGTTAKVAQEFGRSSISIEINPSYEKFWRKRLKADMALDVEYIVRKVT